MRKPTVTTIIPTYNGAEFISACIASVLAQTWSNQEVIVIDDGSTDATPDIVSSVQEIHLIRQENGGVAAARNRGLSLAKGDYVAFIDQDDLWLPDKLEFQINYFENHPEIDVLYNRVHFFVPDGHSRPSWVKPEHMESPQAGQIPSTLCARKEVFSRSGPFDTTYDATSDVAFFMNLKLLGIPFMNHERIVAKRAVHGGNHSAMIKTTHEELMTITRSFMVASRKRQQICS